MPDAPDPTTDTVAWIRAAGDTTLGIYRHDAWWTNVDADDTGVSGTRHNPESVDVLTLLTVAADPERRPPGTTPWVELHRRVEERRQHLGLTQDGLQAAGGPSGRWVQKLRTLTGPPTPRMRTPMGRLDKALQWPSDTAWRIANGGE